MCKGVKSDIYYLIIFSLYKNNRLIENITININNYKNFLNAIIYKNKIQYIKYLLCLLNTHNTDNLELLKISENIDNINDKYELYFNVVYENLDNLNNIILSYPV